MERRTNLGIIKVNNHIFGNIVLDAVSAAGGKAFIASEKGKLLSARGGGLPGAGEISDNICVETTEDSISVKFCVIIQFGVSINDVTGQILDYLEQQIKELFPAVPCEISIIVAGVRSRQIAPRNIEVCRRWN